MAIADAFVPKKENGPAAPPRFIEMSADGACTIAHGTVYITKAGVCAITLDAPPTDMDGAELTFESTTANAHTVTYTPGFNGGGSGADVATFGAAAGNNFTITAWNGVWYKKHTPLGVTFG